MWNCCQLYVTGDGRGDAGVRGVCEGAALWGEWKVYAGTKGSFENVCLFLETDNCYNPTLQAQGGNWTLSNCGNKFSKVLYSVTLYCKYTRALTFENFVQRCAL
jgi:hypothetical protein